MAASPPLSLSSAVSATLPRDTADQCRAQPPAFPRVRHRTGKAFASRGIRPPASPVLKISSTDDDDWGLGTAEGAAYTVLRAPKRTVISKPGWDEFWKTGASVTGRYTPGTSVADGYIPVPADRHLWTRQCVNGTLEPDIKWYHATVLKFKTRMNCTTPIDATSTHLMYHLFTLKHNNFSRHCACM